MSVDPHHWLATYVSALDDARRARIADDATRAVLHGLPELTDPELRSDLAALAVECLRSLTAMAVLPADTWRAPGLPVAGLDLARTLARRGFDVAVVTSIFRIGHTHFWASIMRVADTEIADPRLRMRVLDVMWERLSRWMDVVITRLVEAHQDERERWIRGALARRAELVDAILAGGDVAGAETVLGHALQEHQTAFTMRLADRERPGPGLAALEHLAAEVAAELGAARAFTLPSGANGLWGWVATTSPPDRAQLGACVERHRAVQLAVGRTLPGIEGFRRSHHEAVAAQRVATLLRSPRPVVDYEDVQLLALVSTDAAEARCFVDVQLGDLAAAVRAGDRLRRTALVYLRHHANATAAARTLGVHRNTVRNRVRRAEELLGRPLDVADVGLGLALTLSVELDPAQLRG